MSKIETSPFTPGQPVSLELFTGRRAEVEDLSDRAGAAARGKLGVAFLTGERGIGKSTVANYVRLLGERRHDLLTVHAFMGGADSVEEVVRRVFDRIANVGQSKTWFERIRALFGTHIQELGLFGIQVGFHPSEQELGQIADRFDTALRTVLDRVSPDKSGLLIVLDDINGLASSEKFAHWLKSFVDSVATSDQSLSLFLLLVGLEERRRQLITINPSLARLFHLVEIRPWSTDETRDFFRKAFESANVDVTDEALATMSYYAGGLPVLAHEIGDAAFRIDTDAKISRADAIQAVMSAAEVVGRKHIEPQVFQAIRSQRYRRILQKIPQNFDIVFKRADLMAHLDQEEAKVLDNFLRKMRDLGVLVQDQGEGAGWYRFTSNLHWVYFFTEAKRSQEQQG